MSADPASDGAGGHSGRQQVEPSGPDRPHARSRRFGLVVWFVLLSLLSVSLVSATMAVLLARYISATMLRHDVQLTTEFVNHIFAAEGADAAFVDGPSRPVPPPLARFFGQIGQMPDVLRANIYLLDGTIFWSTHKPIVGQRFTDNSELAVAATGVAQATIHRIGPAGKDEHIDLGPAGTDFVENYMPMHRNGDTRQPVIAVAEVYRTPQDLFTSLQTVQRLVFVGAALSVLLIVAALGSLAAYADRLIHRQEREIAEAERLATAGEMAAAVAHGLRNPLAAIRSSAELALRLRTPERVVPLLDDIVLQSDRLEHWVRQYLTAAEPNSVNRCEDVRPVVAAVRASLGAELERQGIAWIEELEPDLPAIAIGTPLLEQLLSSIAANAIQAMPAGGTLRISAARERGAVLALRIADTGVGMTRDEVQRVFEPFVTSKPTGLGLGLSLASRIVGRHRGRITLDSEVGRGTVVTLTLPIAR